MYNIIDWPISHGMADTPKGVVLETNVRNIAVIQRESLHMNIWKHSKIIEITCIVNKLLQVRMSEGVNA
ncbi:hypothetical protein DP73_07185 [Desulfosporosinus sp. HMP52]|nr:hypothetical protein DP73_07185 [Desulfosporosinus sp. HMP52]